MRPPRLTRLSRQQRRPDANERGASKLGMRQPVSRSIFQQLNSHATTGTTGKTKAIRARGSLSTCSLGRSQDSRDHSTRDQASVLGPREEASKPKANGGRAFEQKPGSLCRVEQQTWAVCSKEDRPEFCVSLDTSFFVPWYPFNFFSVC